jgi:hypothetical protein
VEPAVSVLSRKQCAHAHSLLSAMRVCRPDSSVVLRLVELVRMPWRSSSRFVAF